MKNLMSILLVFAFAIPVSSTSSQPPYSEGSYLHVAATSDLNLRMHPRKDAPTIRVVPYGDSVEVVDTYGFEPGLADRIDWMDGHWIKVKYNGTSGYIFDAFLSSLVPPDHEQQLCFEADGLLPAIDRYVFDHFMAMCIEEGPDHNEELSQFVTVFDNNIACTRTTGDGWYRIEYTFEGYRYSEIINLMRQAMVGTHLRGMFDQSLVFHTDRHDNVSRIDIKLGNYPLEMDITADGIITLQATVIVSVEGS